MVWTFLLRAGLFSSYFFEASYVSMVLVTIVQVVSPFWKYWLCVVIVRVTLQLAISTPVKMIVMMIKRFIVMAFFRLTVQK